MSLTNEQKAFFKKEGYLQLKNFFSQEEVVQLIKAARKKHVGDTIMHDEFLGVTLDTRTTDILHELLGDEILYPGLSFARTGDKPAKFGSRGYHSDAAYETKDFSKFYPIINTGIYLQDHVNYSGGLKLIPRSHNRACIFVRTIPQVLKRMIKATLKGDFKTALYSFDLSPSVNIDNEPGDLLIWSMRTHHSGYGRRPKLFKNLSLHPIIEDLLPDFLFLKDNPDRDVILTVYGTPGEIFEEYMNIQKRKLHRKEHFINSNMDQPHIQEKARKANIRLRNDGHEYATNSKSTFSFRGTEAVSGRPGLKKES